MEKRASWRILLIPPLIALILVICAFHFGSPRLPDTGKLIEAAKGNAK